MDSPEEGLTVHSMRLKVLYTFDKEHKNNCLARCPNVLQVRTAYLDESNQIGIIDLKTCIQTIVAASPELVAKLENDYTVYAYDYSEPDTPLVGQGMLSWALSSPQQVEEEDEGNMVTGRVTRNVLGLFSRNAQETLEVKLRLVPVPNSTQSDYLNSLEKYQQMSGVLGQGFDAQSWSNFVKTNPNIFSRAGTTPPAESIASPVDRLGLETMQRMLAAGASPREVSDMSPSDPMMQPRGPGSRPGSRAGTPGAVSNNNTFNAHARRAGSQISRPSSRTSVREVNIQPVIQSSHQRRESFNSGYYSGDEGFDEGPVKKRAKIVQADWSSKPNLNIERQPDSLRVAASTAASVRLHRPVPVNPALQLQQGSIEEPVRPPTPINRQPRAPMAKGRASSALRTGSFAPESSSPPMQSNQQFPDLASPEETRVQSVVSTPANMPSSPPVMQPRTSAPSSPGLPPMPKDHDSGFMSGENFDIDSYFTDHPLLNFDEDLTVGLVQDDFSFSNSFSNDGLDLNIGQAKTSHSLSAESTQSPTEPPTLSRSQSTAPVQKKPKPPRASSSRPVSRTAMPSPKLAPAPYPRARQIGQEQSQPVGQILSQIPASDPAGPSLQRSHTWAGDMMSDIPMSDLPEPMVSTSNRRSRPKRWGKGETANRLNAAISVGEMPPFCDNCGTIETPAWRKAWAKIFESGWDEFETGTEKDSFVSKESLDQDAEGNITRFKAFKIMKSPTDNDHEFVSVNLCNPCGLWLHKQKCMRPEARWNKSAKDPKEKKKRPSRPRSQRKAAQKRRDDPTKSDGPASSPDSDGMPASEQDVEEDNEAEDSRQIRVDEDGEPELPPMPSSFRANSAEPSLLKPRLAKAHNVDAIVRRVQSSPIRHDIIEGQDLTPKPLRRLLFSPEQTKSQALSEVNANSVRRSPRLNKSVDIFANAKTPSQDKENSDGANDGLDDLFRNDDDDMPHPQTPTPTRRSDRILFKTPKAKTPSRVQKTPTTFSPAAQRLLQAMKTPNALASHHQITAALMGEQASTGEMTPFTLQIHQILSDTGNLSSPQKTQPPSASKTRAGRNNVTDSRGSRKSAHGMSNIFDFPDLPSLNNTSPSSTAGGIGPLVDFSEFTNSSANGNPQTGSMGISDLMMLDDLELQELLSTDVIMPSSPPTNSNHPGISGFTWFDNHGGSTGNNGSIWDEMGGRPSNDATGLTRENQEDDEHDETRRVSPRKNKGKKI